ncbi:MAG TPA: hypothetical protein PKA21_06020 [Kiritimatiellia bacterium]|nr:hypothetical protein [Kiritimatiellia bacterium]HMP97311.1 hypothetical protein [Kiritimatiellia bacterium]
MKTPARRFNARFAFLVLSMIVITHPARAASLVFPSDGRTLMTRHNGQTYFDLQAGGWGANWSYLSFKSEIKSSGKEFHGLTRTTANGVEVTVEAKALQTKPDRWEVRYEARAVQDTAVTMLRVGLHAGAEAFNGGRITVKRVDGGERSFPLPLERETLGESIRYAEIVDARQGKTRFLFDPPVEIVADQEVRIVLARDQLKKDQPARLRILVEMPAPVAFYTHPDAVPPSDSLDAWFAFQPGDAPSANSVFSMADWLDKPAGQHGRITRRGDQLMYHDAPITLWGLNLNYVTCAPSKDLADRRARLYAAYGINAVRLHKYADGAGWAGIQSKDSFTKLDPEGLERMDYFVHRLKEAGIYVKLSSTFGVRPRVGDKTRIPYIDEFPPMDECGRIHTGAGTIFLARELQDMQIEQVVFLLNHKNPHTGFRYADDPAVAVVELINEESALFFNTMDALRKHPTLRRRAAADFTAWLLKRYELEEALLAAWGDEALNSFVEEGFLDESVAGKSIVPAGNPWFYDPEQLEGSQEFRRARLMDTMLYWYEVQNDFYDRYVAAIRATGYEGEIIASNWQAGRAFSHYYNLHSDARIGMIDRHNYFGGASGPRIVTASMLSRPGSGMLSAGMQQVAGLPFMLSEWVHKKPTEWSVEGPAIIGAYGMGLQGWDVSFIFQNEDDGRINRELPTHAWRDVMNPPIIGIFPAVSRQVLRGDVKTAERQAVRNVHMPSLHQGRLGFMDEVVQDGDIKAFTSDRVPAEALAVLRSTVAFTEAFEETPTISLDEFRRDGGLASSTGELFWRPGARAADGYFTIDSAGTKAVVGFAAGQRHRLGDIWIEPDSRFAAIYVTALGRRETLADASRVLVTAIARARNTGMRILDDEILLDAGKGPLLMEPVKARIGSKRTPKRVVLLGHDGVPTNKAIPVRDGVFEIDGARDRTCYYLIEY